MAVVKSSLSISCRALARSPHGHAPHSATSLWPPSPFAGGGVGSGGENIERKSTASSSRYLVL